MIEDKIYKILKDIEKELRRLDIRLLESKRDKNMIDTIRVYSKRNKKLSSKKLYKLLDALDRFKEEYGRSISMIVYDEELDGYYVKAKLSAYTFFITRKKNYVQKLPSKVIGIVLDRLNKKKEGDGGDEG